MRVPLGIPHLHALLGHVPSLGATHGAERRHDFKGESCMLAGDEPGAPSIDLAQKGTGTKVPILNPEVIRLHGRKHQPQH